MNHDDNAPRMRRVRVPNTRGKPGIECLTCKRVSYNPNDIDNVYCANCHRFGVLVVD